MRKRTNECAPVTSRRRTVPPNPSSRLTRRDRSMRVGHALQLALQGCRREHCRGRRTATGVQPLAAAVCRQCRLRWDRLPSAVHLPRNLIGQRLRFARIGYRTRCAVRSGNVASTARQCGCSLLLRIRCGRCHDTDTQCYVSVHAWCAHAAACSLPTSGAKRAWISTKQHLS